MPNYKTKPVTKKGELKSMPPPMCMGCMRTIALLGRMKKRYASPRATCPVCQGEVALKN